MLEFLFPILKPPVTFLHSVTMKTISFSGKVAEIFSCTARSLKMFKGHVKLPLGHVGLIISQWSIYLII